MDKLIEENKRRIKNFDKAYFMNSKNYSVVSALSALEVTNDIQFAYFNYTKDLKEEDYVLKLYALLQGLFVSIDSLYALAIALSGNKNLININNNEVLRELKYIRNDVVGHPANRILNSEYEAYCILDSKSITDNEFSYDIYSKKNNKRKTINIIELLESYYKESNNLLDSLYKLSNTKINNAEMGKSITSVINLFNIDADYYNALEAFIDKYKKNYQTNDNNRILWRFEHIKMLYELKLNDKNLNDVIMFCIEAELHKIYELIYNTKYKNEACKKLPRYIGDLYRMLNKEKELYPYIDYLKDTTHPYFEYALEKIYNVALNQSNEGAVMYLNLIKKYYSLNNGQMVHTLIAPFRLYKRK